MKLPFLFARPATPTRGTAYLYDPAGACIATLDATEGREAANARAEAIAAAANFVTVRGPAVLDLLHLLTQDAAVPPEAQKFCAVMVAELAAAMLAGEGEVPESAGDRSVRR